MHKEKCRFHFLPLDALELLPIDPISSGFVSNGIGILSTTASTFSIQACTSGLRHGGVAVSSLVFSSSIFSGCSLMMIDDKCVCSHTDSFLLFEKWMNDPTRGQNY